MSARAMMAAVLGVGANAGALAWFGGAAYETLTRGAVLAEAMRAHRFVPSAAVDQLVPVVGAVHVVVAAVALVGLCTRSMRPLGPLAAMAALTVFTAYLGGVWLWGDSSAGCGCSGHAGATVPVAVMKNAAAWAAASGAFWVVLPRKAAAG